MMPTVIMAGAAASTLWGSQCTYFNESAVRYARLLKENHRRKSLAPEFSSNNTSVVVLSVRNSLYETREETSTENQQSNIYEPSEIKADDVLQYKCKNPKCENVEEFQVSEIPLNCVQFLNNSADNNCAPTAEQKHDSNLPSTSSNDNPSKITAIKDKSESNVRAEPSAQKNEIFEAENSISTITKVAENQDSNNVSNNPQCDVEPIDLYQGKQIIPVRSTTLESITGCIFGCHGIAYYSAQICSNIISHYILRSNSSPDLPSLSSCSCGASFCNTDLNCIDEETEEITHHARYLLCGVSLVTASMACLCIILFLDPLKKAKTEQEKREPVTLSLNLVLATFSHCKKREQLFLVPISFFEGMLQGFYTADFTRSYVACAWGASHVGSISIFYGVACVIFATASGFLVKYAGRKPLFLLGQVMNIVLMTFLLLWNPDSETPFKFYIAAVFFGGVTGIFWSQLLSFYGLLFKEDEEAAFASYYLFSSLGWTTSFLYSDHICTDIKIYLLLSTSFLGTIGYFLTERSYSLRKQKATLRRKRASQM
ncbi:UNC93-like protein [Trichonephila clavipes]|nr:UNC93-like protein [Trichonephila clavipes]